MITNVLFFLFVYINEIDGTLLHQFTKPLTYPHKLKNYKDITMDITKVILQVPIYFNNVDI